MISCPCHQPSDSANLSMWYVTSWYLYRQQIDSGVRSFVPRCKSCIATDSLQKNMYARAEVAQDVLNLALRWRHNGLDGVSNHQITIVYSIIYSDADQRKHQSSASLVFVRVIRRGQVNYPHKWPVTRKMFPFHDVIMGSTVTLFKIKVRSYALCSYKCDHTF